jgi:hypothetical protein
VGPVAGVCHNYHAHHAHHATAWCGLGIAVLRIAHRLTLQRDEYSQAVMWGCHQAQRLAALHDRATTTGDQATPCVAAGDDAPASRDIVLLGDSGTPLSPLTETTEHQKRSAMVLVALPLAHSAYLWAG